MLVEQDPNPVLRNAPACARLLLARFESQGEASSCIDCSGWRTVSLRRRRFARSWSSEIRTPCGWKRRSDAFFSLVTGLKGCGACSRDHRRPWVITARPRLDPRCAAEADPRHTSRASVAAAFIAEWSTWNFWASAIMHGRRLMIPIASVVTEWSLGARFHETW